MKKLVTMRAALADPTLFAPLLGGDSWAAWRVLLIAIMGERLTDEERVTFTALTGREREPEEPVDEFAGVMGRRAGKSRSTAVLAAFIGGLVDHRHVLAPGERGVLAITAASVDQAGGIFNFIAGTFDAVPRLGALVTGRTADTLSLRTGVDIRVKPASFRTVRSATFVAAIADELAFWRSDESVNPDEEVLAAMRPSLITTGGPLIMISSPHARKGELWRCYRENFGPKGDPRILVAQAASRVMNATLPQKDIDKAYARDAARAAAEWGARFRDDVEDFLSVADLDKVVVLGRGEIPPQSGISYVGFADPSGGKADSFTLAIAHNESGKAVLDLVAEVRPPFSPDVVTEEFAATLKSYGLREVTGDRYGGLWPAERFEKHGIKYKPSEQPKSAIYGAALPLFTSGQVELLDNPRLAAQLCALERRVNRGGKDSIDHPTGGNDDVANAACGALVLAAENAVNRHQWTPAAMEGLAAISYGAMSDRQIVESWFQ